MCIINAFWDIIILFWIPFIWTPCISVLFIRPSAHMQFSVERLLADSCARLWRPNDCRGTCAHIQFWVVHNYANDQWQHDVYDTTVVCALLLRFRKKRKREYWVHPIYSERLLKGKFYTLYHELRQYSSNFFNYCRMSVDSFDELLHLLKPHILYKNTKWRLALPPEERLIITLR
jgi:hypothetical protein